VSKDVIILRRATDAYRNGLAPLANRTSILIKMSRIFFLFSVFNGEWSN
jgi:hypothetical protein